MPFTHTNSRGQTYILHRRTTRTSGGQERTLHYFSRSAGPDAIEAVPDGYEVTESSATGLPLLKKRQA